MMAEVSSYDLFTFSGSLRKGSIPLYRDGTQTHSLCYVDDLVEGFIRLMNTDEGFTVPMILGNSGEFSMIEIGAVSA